MNILTSFINRLKMRKDSVAYWRNKGASIGDNCQISPTATLGSEPYLITIGDNVRINNGVKIITHDGGVWVLRNKFSDLTDIDIIKPVRIGNNVHIGTDATICPGVNIGDNCIIGIGAIVTKNVQDNSIAAGIPAKKIESIEEYLEKHSNDFLHTKNLSYEEKKSKLLNHFKIENTIIEKNN